jgi:hypothetical protein
MFSAAINWVPKKTSQRTEAKTGSLTSPFQLQLSGEKKESEGEREREKKGELGGWGENGTMRRNQRTQQRRHTQFWYKLPFGYPV